MAARAPSRWPRPSVMILGFVAGVSVGTGRGCERKDPRECAGYCGPGTQCVAERCIPAAEPSSADAGQDEEKRKRKRKGGRRKGAADQAAGVKFVPVDDSNVPRYEANRDQVLDMKAGTERLGDRDVTRHMQGLEGKFNECLATAAQYSDDDLGSGSIEFRLNVEPTGKVTGVAVEAPANLRVFGIVPCLRKTVHGSRFPTWDGPPMDVEYRFRVE